MDAHQIWPYLVKVLRQFFASQWRQYTSRQNLAQNRSISWLGIETRRPAFTDSTARHQFQSPCQYIDTTQKAIDCATTLPLTVFI